MDFTIGFNTVFCILFLTCLTGKWSFMRNSNYRRTVKSIVLIKTFFGLVEMMFGLVNVSFSLPCTLKPLACEYSPHSATSPLVSLQNDMWRTRAEIPHWWQTPFHGGSSGSITISGFKTTKCWESPLVSDDDVGREPTTNSTHMRQAPSPILYLCTGPF